MATTDAKQSPESETLSIATVTTPKVASSGAASAATPVDRVAIPSATNSSVPATHHTASPAAPVAASAAMASAPPALSSSADSGKATDDTKKQSQFRRNVFDASWQCFHVSCSPISCDYLGNVWTGFGRHPVRAGLLSRVVLRRQCEEPGSLHRSQKLDDCSVQLTTAESSYGTRATENHATERPIM